MKQQKKEVRLSEYKPYAFEIPQIELNFLIHEDYVSIESTMRIEPSLQGKSPLVLKGLNLELEEIRLGTELLLAHQSLLIRRQFLAARHGSTTASGTTVMTPAAANCPYSTPQGVWSEEINSV